MMVCFAVGNLFSFMKSYLLIRGFSACATSVLLRKYFPVPMSSSSFPILSSVRISLYSLILRSLIHLNLSFVAGDRYGSIFILVHPAIQFEQHRLLKMLCFLQCVCLTSSQKSGVYSMWT